MDTRDRAEFKGAECDQRIWVRKMRDSGGWRAGDAARIVTIREQEQVEPVLDVEPGTGAPPRPWDVSTPASGVAEAEVGSAALRS